MLRSTDKCALQKKFKCYSATSLLKYNRLTRWIFGTAKSSACPDGRQQFRATIWLSHKAFGFNENFHFHNEQQVGRGCVIVTGLDKSEFNTNILVFLYLYWLYDIDYRLLRGPNKHEHIFRWTVCSTFFVQFKNMSLK